MLEHIFPFSYVALLIGLLVGIGFTVACVGLFSAIVIFVCISIGMIKIMPLVRFSNNIFNMLLPNSLNHLESNIKQSYKVLGNTSLEEGKYIYMWHPHGAFSSSMFFHTVTNLTSWPRQLKGIRCVALNMIHMFPFMKEIFEEFNIVPSNYHDMKTALADHSISVSAGGMREMLYEHTVLVARRRGIFKMALETGTPLVPVISVGDTKLWELVKIPDWIQDMLEPYDICVPIPTIKSAFKCIGILQNPLKDPIVSVIGEPIPVTPIDNPKESDISELRSKYIEALKQMYKKETGADLIIA